MEEIDDFSGMKPGTIFTHDSMTFMMFFDFFTSNFRVLNLKDGFCPENQYESLNEFIEDFPGYKIMENLRFE